MSAWGSRVRPSSRLGLRLMRSWQVDSYGSFDNLQLRSSSAPSVAGPRDVLVRVHAASVNPIDARMLGGYGSTALGYLRWAYALATSQSAQLAKPNEPFPLTFGQDFSGTVQAVGKSVTTYKAGDEVWGIVGAHRQGCHGELAATSDNCISMKPKNLAHVDAASIPYCSLTFWAAASTIGGLNSKSAPGKRVLVTGGSGGVGTFGIQLLKAWGASVVTTVSTDAVPLANRLGADLVIDYKTQDVGEALRSTGGVDVVVDCASEADVLACIRPGGIYVTCTSPVLTMFDQQGLAGAISVARTFTYRAVKAYQQYGVYYRWAYVMPNADALRQICILVEEEKIRPVIDKIFPLEKLPEAYKHVAEGRTRGKTVVQVSSV